MTDNQQNKMKPTDLQLKTALFKMLREHIVLKETLADKEYYYSLQWKYGLYGRPSDVSDTELLHLCHMAEGTLDEVHRRYYFFHLFGTQRLEDGNLWKAVHASWQERVIALAKAKGIELE